VARNKIPLLAFVERCFRLGKAGVSPFLARSLNHCQNLCLNTHSKTKLSSSAVEDIIEVPSSGFGVPSSPNPQSEIRNSVS
jgi:hypothetical protein